MLILLLILAQEPSAFEPDPINAQVYLKSGEKLEVAEIRLRGNEPTTFELKVNGAREIVSVFRVSRITRLEGRQQFEVLLDSGETLRGALDSLTFVGLEVVERDTPTVTNGTVRTGERQQVRVDLSNVVRIHFAAGFQLRSCGEGHYEQYTPHPFCPVCGQELELGPYSEQIPDRVEPPPPYFRLRLSPRDPTTRGGQ